MSARLLPVVCRWQDVEVHDPEDGTVAVVRAAVPVPRYRKLAAKQYAVGHEAPLQPLEARSQASHGHYFAALNDAFANLPEDLPDAGKRLNLSFPPSGFVNAEHMRKWTLCQTEYCDTIEFDFDTKEEAARLARFYRKGDTYAHITVRGSHVTIKTAASQSFSTMAKGEFEASKRAVLDILESIIGLKSGTLMKEAGKSA